MKDLNNYIIKVRILSILFITLLCSESLSAQKTRSVTLSIGKSNTSAEVSQPKDDLYCDPSNMPVICTQEYDDQGCYLKVTYYHNYTATAMNAWALPHGIYMEISGANFTSGAIYGGGSGSAAGDSWLAAASPMLLKTITPTIIHGSNQLCWIREPNLATTGSVTTSTTAIPSNTIFCFKAYMNVYTYPLTITFHELTGFAWPVTDIIDLNQWMCESTGVLDKPQKTFTIPPVTICAGQDAMLQLTSNPGLSANPYYVEWYRCDCSTNACTLPWNDQTGWELVQWGWASDQHPTGTRDYTTCYAAKIIEEGGCFIYWSDVSTVTVCQPGAPDITASPVSPYDPLMSINGLNRYCDKWEGNLTIPAVGFTCGAKISWTKKKNHVVDSNFTYGSYPGDPVPTGLLDAHIPTPHFPDCYDLYTFTAHIKFDNDACPQLDREFNIYIDCNVPPGTITAAANSFVGGTASAPELCYNGATTLTYSGLCTEVVKWEQCVQTDPCFQGPWRCLEWSDIPTDPGTSNTFWTNALTASTKYRVTLRNGACGPYYSYITVTVKPELKVTLNANNNILCRPGSPCPEIVLNANIECRHSFMNLTYKWYHIGTATGLTLIGTNNTNTFALNSPALQVPGYYYVEVYDPVCGMVTSGIVTICRPTVKIIGPLAICPGESANLVSLVEDCCSSTPCTYEWLPGGETTPNITVSPSVSTPYTLRVTCGCCVIITSFPLTVCL